MLNNTLLGGALRCWNVLKSVIFAKMKSLNASEKEK